MTPLTLHQFPSSHFNEKARWALDYKHLMHERISYLPGPHMSKIKKLTGGNTSTTPVLETEVVIQGSAQIIDHLEQISTERPLYPTDPDQLKEALEWQSRLDSELGPAVRTVVFSVFVEEPGFLARTFASNKPWLSRSLYRLMIPALLPIIKKANGADSDENIMACQKTVDEYLAEIAARINDNPYLVGDQFSVADLTAAALIAPLVQLEHPDMKRPTPIPQTMQSLLRAYEQHPTIQWVKKLYDQHRPVTQSRAND